MVQLTPAQHKTCKDLADTNIYSDDNHVGPR